MRKKKIFLAAYVNYINAQNINCKSIATHLDKDKFKVTTLLVGNKEIPNINGVNFITCFKPHRITIPLIMLYGILSSDISYLPKHLDVPYWVLRLAKFLKKNTFTTIEENICDKSKKNTIDAFGSEVKMEKHFDLISNIYGITQFLIDNTACGVKLRPSPLSLGVEGNLFSNDKNIDSLYNIVFIGSLLETKNIDEIIEVAAEFPDIFFNIVGDGPIKENLQSKATSNVVFHGKKSHNELSFLLKDMDLHLLLSRSEGFPKVILETSSSSIPSLLYNDYGASEWIVNNENGFIVQNKKEVILKLKELQLDVRLLNRNSKGAFKMSQKFYWKKVIKNWELEILKMLDEG